MSAGIAVTLFNNNRFEAVGGKANTATTVNPRSRRSRTWARTRYANAKKLGNAFLPFITKKSGTVLIVDPVPGVEVLALRRQGIESVVKPAGYKTAYLPAALDEGQNLTTIGAYLQAHPDVVAVVGLGDPTANPACSYIEKNKLSIPVAAFDVDAEAIQHIQAGCMKTATDQQPYLQGYLSAANMAFIAQGPPLPADDQHRLVHRHVSERRRDREGRRGRQGLARQRGAARAPRGRAARRTRGMRTMEPMQTHRVISFAEDLLRRREFGPLVGFAALIVIFGTMSDHLFSRQQVNGITSLSASIGIVAVGVTFLMISGEFDLSVGAVFAISAVVFGKFIDDYGFSPWLAFPAVLGIAACIGLVNGLVTTRFGIPSFITTLATLLVVQGVDLVISGGNTILYFGHSSLMNALGGTIPHTTLEYRVLWFVG